MSEKYKLVIVESPTKAKAIEKYLGPGFKVVASSGHIKDLPQKELGVDLKSFELTIVPIPGKEEQIGKLIKLAKEADEVYLASDDDREGEAIAFHIQESIKRKDAKRVLFREITKPAILIAMKNPLALNVKKYEAQKTRRVLDRLVGYKVSPVLWEKLQKGLSAGRVQSVALRVIVEREDEIINFIPEKWFQITAKLKKNDIEFESKYFGINPTKKTEIENEEQAKKILDEVLNKDFIVKDVINKEKKQYSTPPFTTSKLQQEAAYKLGFSSKITMQLAQKLYEGINISGSGLQGLITYMRTDSVRTEPQAITSVRDYILQKFGKDYLPDEAVIHTKKKADAKIQDAHEAIRPTNLEFDPEKIKNDLDPDEFKLYSLIWNKFIASQMNPAILDQTTVTFDVNNHFFRSSGSVVRFNGFRAVYMEASEEKNKTKKGDDGDGDEEKEQSLNLPILIIGDKADVVKPPTLQEKWTSPPARFNEGTLVKELEDKGIGRPATYAAIIDNIKSKEYIFKNKDNRLQPTELGTKLCRMLISNFPTEMDISFTANMELNLDLIEAGQEDWVLILTQFWKQLEKTIQIARETLPNIEQSPREIRPEDKTGIHCDKCSDGEFIIRKGKNGSFLACSQYPTCKATKNFKLDKKGKIIIVEPKKDYYEDEKCPTCSKRMVIVKGTNGKFLSCEDYPNCKTTRPMPSEFVCTKCKIGKLIERKSKTGKVFYGCSKYPTCDYVLWNKPVKHPCESCGNPYLGLIEGKNKEGKKYKFFQCPNCQTKAYPKKD